MPDGALIFYPLLLSYNNAIKSVNWSHLRGYGHAWLFNYGKVQCSDLSSIPPLTAI
jgi:hypothetical protein